MSDYSINDLDSMTAEFKRQIGHAKAIYQKKEEELGNRIKVLENELLLLQDKQPELLRGEKEWRETALIYEKRIEEAKIQRMIGNKIIEDYFGNIFLAILEKKTTHNCFLDGKALCLTEKNFINLQESRAMFIELTPEQIEEFKTLE